jgi:hypothetical protein
MLREAVGIRPHQVVARSTRAASPDHSSARDSYALVFSAEYLRGLEIDDQLVFGRWLNRHTPAGFAPPGSCHATEPDEVIECEALSVANATKGQATVFNIFVTPVLSGSAVSVANLWASPESSLVCSVTASNCWVRCALDNLIISVGDFAVNSARA